MQHYLQFCRVVPMSRDATDWLVFDRSGRRKYLSRAERQRFCGVARAADEQTAALCLLLAETGCRISEAIALTPEHIDPCERRLILRTLKRRKLHFRAVPVSDELLKALLALASGAASPEQARLFPICRQTAWRRVKQVMRMAGIAGPQASPKGLRHGFGMAAAASNIPQHLTQRWLGHARPETTAIYQDAAGAEERAFASRLW